MKLKEWLKKFIDYRNSFKRESLQIQENDNEILVDNSKQITKYVVFEDLSNLNKKLIDERIVCLNNRKNIGWIINNWDGISNTDTFFLFVNPNTNEHWTIRPKHHSVVVEKKELKKGLIALMESINLYE